jgi:tRNA nucleotidyltransferase (CCA-adding enzyme)
MSNLKAIQSLKHYLVGGAVRDKLLNRDVYDRDWVVIESTPKEMLSLGFSQVGKDFPVFLHPETKEEYALARTERKQGEGYTGFICNADPSVSLEEDLIRRDLTINAMAMDDSGKIIDPYNGQNDLNNRVLRHVSDAFIEDPLRVLRVARFAARFHEYNFTIADETLLIMQKISNSGELATLSGERIWQEMSRSLEEKHPDVFFQTLRDCHALEKIWPELNALWNIPNPALHHPEVCSGVHTMMVLQQSVKLSSKISIRFAALCHDLGKTLSPKETLPKHYGHEKSGLPLVEKICNTLKVPNQIKSLALKVCQFHLHCHRAFELKPQTILTLFNNLDVWRKPEEFEDFLLVCQADATGRLGFENNTYPQAQFLKELFTQTSRVKSLEFVEQGLTGIKIKEAINDKKLRIIEALKTSLNV